MLSFVVCLPFHSISFVGSSMRPLSSQHCGLYSRQRIQLEELANDTSAGPPYVGFVAVRSQSEESETNGAPDKEPSGAEAVHLPCRRRIPRVSSFNPLADPFTLNPIVPITKHVQQVSWIRFSDLSTMFCLFPSSPLVKLSNVKSPSKWWATRLVFAKYHRRARIAWPNSRSSATMERRVSSSANLSLAECIRSEFIFST